MEALPGLRSPLALQIQLLPHAVGGLEGGGEIVLDPGCRQLLAGERISQVGGDLAPAAHHHRVRRQAEGADQRHRYEGARREAAHRVAQYLGPDRRVVERSPVRGSDLRTLPVREAAHEHRVDQADSYKISCQ